eukprot:3460706-Pyramimonas_sp.AAC.1
MDTTDTTDPTDPTDTDRTAREVIDLSVDDDEKVEAAGVITTASAGFPDAGRAESGPTRDELARILDAFYKAAAACGNNKGDNKRDAPLVAATGRKSQNDGANNDTSRRVVAAPTTPPYFYAGQHQHRTDRKQDSVTDRATDGAETAKRCECGAPLEGWFRFCPHCARERTQCHSCGSKLLEGGSMSTCHRCGYIVATHVVAERTWVSW